MSWVVKLYVTCKQIQDTLYKCFLPHGSIDRSNIFECISNQTSMNALVTHVWTVELAPTEWICSRAVVYRDSVEHGAKQVSLQWNPVLKKYELYLFTLKGWHCKFWIFRKATSVNCPTFLRVVPFYLCLLFRIDNLKTFYSIPDHCSIFPHSK